MRGELALAQGDPHTAALQLELATAAPDEDAYLLSRLADAQEQTGDRELAERTMREAVRVDACQQHIWLTRGRWAERDGDLAAAEQAYGRALECDEGASRALLALNRVLRSRGRPERGLELVARASSRRGGHEKQLLARALSTASAAEIRFALDSWLSLEPPDRLVIEAAVEAALARSQPSLSLSLSELGLAGLELPTRARLALSAFDAGTARALLARHQEGELGGPQQAARLAQLAGDLERAELYASLALGQGASDELHVLRAEALAALGDATRALDELRALSSPALRRSLAVRQLTALGLPALARELASEAD